ncbi:MAG: hypothetical protein K8R36_19905, partial [Planctomycetales bacterium]|nr:hypothetical protein [Planctomycetales bacterium]
MKLPNTSLLMVAFAAMGIAGCETQPSSPLAASPGAKSVPTARQGPAPSSAPADSAAGKSEVVQATHETASEPTATTPPATEAASPTTESKPPEKPAPTETTGSRPKADREPTKPGDAEKITFDDLILGMQADMVFRPFMLTDRAKALEGKRVRLTGEMYAGSVSSKEKLKQFIVLRNKECKYGAGGQADHVADVVMKEGHTAKFTIGTIRV